MTIGLAPPAISVITVPLTIFSIARMLNLAMFARTKAPRSPSIAAQATSESEGEAEAVDQATLTSDDSTG